MFGIRYHNELLDLIPGQNPVIEWISTAFNDTDTFLGSYSYPIDLADSPKNNKLLGHANQLAMRASRKDITVLVELFDMPWKECILTFDIDDRIYKSHLKIDHGVFASTVKKMKVAEVFTQMEKGAFVDHKWEVVGVDSDGTVAAILNAVTGPGAAPWTLYPYQNSKIFGSHNEETTPEYTAPSYINRWPALIASIDPDQIKETWYSFSFYLDWVLKKVCEYLGFEAVGNFFDDPFIKSIVLDNNTIYHLHDVFAEDGFKLAPARHLADLTIGELFKRIRNYPRLIFDFNSDTRKAWFVLSDKVLTSPERIELDGYLTKGFGALRQAIQGFEAIQEIDDKDEMFKLLPYTKNFFIGSGVEKIKLDLKVSTTFMITRQNDLGAPFGNFRIPIKEQVGNAFGDKAAGSEAHNPNGYGRNEFALKFLSFRGLHPDSLGNLYPYATSDGMGTDGVTEICQSLWLGGSNGVLENYHRKWCTFLLRTEPVELRGQLPNVILNRMSPVKKVRFSTEEGIHLEAVMDKMQFSTDKEKLLLETRIGVYPIYSQAAIDISSNTGFNPGEIANPDTVFVKIVQENLRERYRKKFLGAKVKESEVVDVVLYFFSDFAGTVPLIVNNLPVTVTVHYKGLHPYNYTDTPSTQTASGNRHLWVASAIRWYQWQDEFRTYDWTINAGSGYKVIF